MIPEGARPPIDQDPTLWQLSLMAMAVGGPFFVLSGSAPMLQRWFAGTDHPDAENPYFLYGASNIGSLCSLLAYPFFIEPYLDISAQSEFWLLGFCALIGLIVLSAMPTLSNKYRQIKNETDNSSTLSDTPITWGMRLKWLYLSFLPSSLMLGVTTFVTTDIASVPLIWIVPLALYVSTFIIVFARRQIFKTSPVFIVQGILLAFLTANMMAYGKYPVQVMLITHMLLFFISALGCHMLLAASRPSSRHLTEFYLLMSLGGALGGIFNAIIAPKFFFIPLEYPLVLVLIIFLRFSDQPAQLFITVRDKFSQEMQKNGLNAVLNLTALLFGILLFFQIFIFNVEGKINNLGFASVIFVLMLTLINKRWIFGFSTAFTLLFFLPGFEVNGVHTQLIKLIDRNYFGVIRVVEFDKNQRALIHGTTTHGTQPLEKNMKRSSSPITAIIVRLQIFLQNSKSE